ncbi:MAG: hypothetical protein QNJ63_13105 [Calothrix sp. MO_192.B10]|nr:hypothetical protein [Calothrix sp. MO_192.B10]
MPYGFQAFKRDLAMIFSDRYLSEFILKSLKRGNFVHTHDGGFAQCLSPNLVKKNLPD